MGEVSKVNVEAEEDTEEEEDIEGRDHLHLGRIPTPKADRSRRQTKPTSQ